MSNALLVGILLAVGVGVIFLLFRRKPSTTDRQAQASTATGSTRERLLQIVIPETGACCAAARRIETHRFNKQLAPPLPLAECSMKAGCHCRYQPVPDRRIGERRQNPDKRASIRFEESPRRQAHGRRTSDTNYPED